MSEENKGIVHEYFEEVVKAGNHDRAEGLISPGYVEHQELPGGEGRQGIEVAKGFLSLMRRAFPDFRFELEELIAEGDKVAARVSVSGTHLEEMMGLAPTGKRVRTSGIEVFRFEGDKIAEHWAAFEVLDRLQQIGMVAVSGPTLLARTLMHQGRKLLAKVRSSR
jgi:predicted ester cyclase